MPSWNNLRHFVPSRAVSAAATRLTLRLALVLIAAPGQVLDAQIFTVIHHFTGGPDGGLPDPALTTDRAGNVYGSNSVGGANGEGDIYRLAPSGSGGTLTPITPGGNANYLIFGPNGRLYEVSGYASSGGIEELAPPFKPCTGLICYWVGPLVYPFSVYPNPGIIFDGSDVIYGTFAGGGTGGNGGVYKLAKSNGSWTLTTLYRFSGGMDGGFPYWGVVSDQSGSLYGTTGGGGAYGCGTVFQLVQSGSNWTENVLYSFTCGSDGQNPGSLVFDGGNLYGIAGFGQYGFGVVFELSAPSEGRIDSNWSYAVIYAFRGGRCVENQPGGGWPLDPLLMDTNGNLYGITDPKGGGPYGTVYGLSPVSNGWAETVLHCFTGGADGAGPRGLALANNNTLYGTAEGLGQWVYGVAYQITGIGGEIP